MKNLILLRQKQGLTQQELADKLGITRASLSHYEKGRREMNYDLLIHTADFFNVTVDCLLEREDMLFVDARLPICQIVEIYNSLDQHRQEKLLAYANGLKDSI